MMRIGVIGAGMIGSTLSKLWVDAGHDVCLASRHPEELMPLIDQLGKSASSGTPAQAAAFGEVVLLAIPLKAIPDLAREVSSGLAGKVVLDASNAYESRDGKLAADATHHPSGSAGWAAAKFPDAMWVKAFNTVNFRVLASEAHRDGDRLGIPLASDSDQAMKTASALVDDAGFEPVIAGSLATGKEFEPGTRTYNTGMSASQLRQVFPPSRGERTAP